MTDKLIEAVARAMYTDTWSDVGGKWELVETKDVWRGYARAALAAIEASGHAIVPVVKTTMGMYRSDGKRRSGDKP